MDTAAFRARIEEQIRSKELIEPGGAVTCLVSGGADSTCLWHVLRELDYGVSALHVNHGLRGAESEEDARFCREAFGAEIVDARGAAHSEAELRDLRYSFAGARRPRRIATPKASPFASTRRTARRSAASSATRSCRCSSGSIRARA